MKIRAVIIDDMPMAIESLKADLREYEDQIELVGTADGVLSGAKLLRAEKPDLIFLDIHMGDGDGFDLLEIIEQDQLKVIFTTASEEHAIKAFEFEAFDYLLKPIDPDRLKAAIDRLVAAQSNTATVESDQNAMQYLALNTQEEIRRVHIEEIIRCASIGNYTQFYFSDGSKLLVTKTLKEFETKLPETFLRVHQSHLVNKAFIKSYIKTEGGYLLMQDGTHVPVAVRKKTMVMEAIAQ
ncbi:MAG: response regulator transcription factor [Saprospiraceae bacterium]|nr:response regulator transcription factor [Saprospiraceae bacterium]